MSAEPILGIYRGSVSNNQDPLNEARVTLLIPQVLGDAESAWAVPTAPTNTVPPVGQTLWVQFSGGDITKPVYSPLGIKDVQDTVDNLPDSEPLDVLPPKEPTALTLTTVQYVTNEGVTQARVTASWTPPTENQDGTNLTDLSHYLLQTSYDGTNWSGGLSTKDALVVLDGLHTGVDVTVRVQAVDNQSNASLWATAHITSASSTTPPPVPSAPVVLGVLGGLRVTWDGKDSTGTAMPAIFSHVQVQRDTVSAFSNPVVIGTLPGPDFLYDSIQNYANAYFYRLVAYSKVGVASAPSGANSDTPKQAVAQDILDASLTAAKIAVGAIDNTKLAANAVTASAIANGAVEAGKLAALAVGTTNIANNAVTGAQMADATIGSAKIINGAIGNAQIADAAINNAKIANLDAGKITTGSLDASRIAAGSLDASKITAGTLTATQVLAGSLTGDRLAANTVTANQIAANTITANQMAAGTITAQSGVIASIDASKITVGKLTASQIDATNLVVTGGNVSGTVASATTATSSSSATTVTGSIGASVTVPAGQVSGTIPNSTVINGNSILTGSLTADKLTVGTQGSIFQKFYDTGSEAARWTAFNSGAAPTSVAVTDSQVGGYVMRAVGYPGSLYRADVKIPFDPGSLYRVTAVVRQTVSNSTPGTNQGFYAGLLGWAADGTTMVNRDGSNSTSSQNYAAASNVAQTTGAGWTRYTGYIKGWAAAGSSGSGGATNSPTAPGVLHSNVRYISPMLYLNYTGGTGTQEVALFTIEVIESGSVGTVNIQDGAITATKVAARSITADKVVIGDTSNILLDPDFTQNSSAWNWSTSVVRTASSDPSVTTGAPAPWVAKLTSQTALNTDLTWKHSAGTLNAMPVSPGETYYVEAWVAASSTCNSNMRFFLATSDAAGANTSWPSTTSLAPSSATTWTKISGQITIPAGKYMATFGIGASQTTPTTAAGYWLVTNVKMRKAMDNALVVAGSITADKLDANAINGKTINGVTITGSSTVTGATIRSAASGARVEMSAANPANFAQLLFYGATASDQPGIVSVDGTSSSRSLAIYPPASSSATNIPQFYQGYTNNGSNTETVIGSDSIELDGILSASNIVTGRVSITPSAANEPTSVTITGLGLIGSSPRAVATPSTTVPGTSVTGVGCTGVTTDAITIWLTRVNTISTGVDYIVIAS